MVYIIIQYYVTHFIICCILFVVAHAVDDDYQSPTTNQPVDIHLHRLGKNVDELMNTFVIKLIDLVSKQSFIKFVCKYE